MDMVTVGLVGIAAVLLAVQFEGVKGEYAIYITAAAGCFLFFCGLSRLRIVFETLRGIRDQLDLNPVYLNALLKLCGITYIAEFASGICKDAGYGAVANQIEIFGKLSMLAVSMPVALALLQTFGELFP